MWLRPSLWRWEESTIGQWPAVTQHGSIFVALQALVHGDQPSTVCEAGVAHFGGLCILLPKETKGHGTMVRGIV
jgi:hypothetical protein